MKNKSQLFILKDKYSEYKIAVPSSILDFRAGSNIPKQMLPALIILIKKSLPIWILLQQKKSTALTGYNKQLSL